MADRLTPAELDALDTFVAASQKARGVRRQAELLGLLVRRVPDLVADLRDARAERDRLASGGSTTPVLMDAYAHLVASAQREAVE